MALLRVALITAALASPTISSAQPVSFSRADYPASTGPRAVVAGDFDRDGEVDLALADNGRDAVTILLNRTAASQGFLIRQEIIVGGGPFDLAAGDLNHDGRLDLVVANADLSTIDVLLGQDGGRFEAPLHISAAGNPRGVALADMDTDGWQDIIYTQYSANSVQVLHSDRTGSNFVARRGPDPAGDRPQSVAVGDVNRDGRPDIVVANTGASPLTVLKQQVGGTFLRSEVPGQEYLNVVTTGDFNGDGWLDIAAASSPRSLVVVFLSHNGVFKSLPIQAYQTGSSPRGIATADVNKDGALDLVTANRGTSNVTLVLGWKGAPGAFVTPISIAAGAGSRDVVVADFSRDGQLDIATANEFGNSVTVLTNTTQPVSRLFWEAHALPVERSTGAFLELADFNKNGRVDVLTSEGLILDGTTVVALTTGGSSPRHVFDAATGDFNQDGNTDAALLTRYFDQWPYRIVADVYHGDGAGGFRHAGGFGPFTEGFDARAADVNVDGRPDLVVLDRAADSFQVYYARVLLGTASGFQTAIDVQLPSLPKGFDIEDVNRDGKPDLVTSHGTPASFGINIAFGDGSGNFPAADFLPAACDRGNVEAVDVNRDGAIDIVSGGDWALLIWLGASDGTFGAAQQYAYGTHTSGMLVTDVTADGRLDVVSPVFGVFVGRGDGTFIDPIPLNATWGAGQTVDYDRDGRMDLVIADWDYTRVLLSRAQRGPNLRPVADAGPEQLRPYEAQFGEEGTYISVGQRSFDPNLDAITYEWRDRDGTIVGTDWAFEYKKLEPGSYELYLTVRDPYGAEGTDTLRLTVLPMKETVINLYDVPEHRDVHGAWQLVSDPTAAERLRAWHPNAGAPKVTSASASPVDYVTMFVLADPTQEYKLWVRLRAENNSWANDSIYVQFGEGVLTADGQTRYRIGTTDALDINLEQCSGCGVSGWGWRDERWGSRLADPPMLLRFPRGGWHVIRIQTREDGVSFDQIVLSAERYRTTPPGPPKNDATILPARPLF